MHCLIPAEAIAELLIAGWENAGAITLLCYASIFVVVTVERWRHVVMSLFGVGMQCEVSPDMQLVKQTGLSCAQDRLCCQPRPYL